jgi:hypothetical protein
MSAGSSVRGGSASAGRGRVGEGIPGRKRAGAGKERAGDHLLDRLQKLRTIVPVSARELASAPPKAAALRLENRRLLERIRELQRKHVRPA